MNKERFHNTLAMTLGYEQILNDKRYSIIVDDNTDDPKVEIENSNGCSILKFRVSEVEGMKQKGIHLNNGSDADKELKMILDAVHRAYKEATTQPF